MEGFVVTKILKTETCIRDENGCICAWTVGMSDDEIVEFLKKYPGTYVSTVEI